MSNSGKPNFSNDKDFIRLTADRWKDRKGFNRVNDQSSGAWKDGECRQCQYYVRLQGSLAKDWGVCMHEWSRFDGEVRFKHDVCRYFSESDARFWSLDV